MSRKDDARDPAEDRPITEYPFHDREAPAKRNLTRYLVYSGLLVVVVITAGVLYYVNTTRWTISRKSGHDAAGFIQGIGPSGKDGGDLIKTEDANGRLPVDRQASPAPVSAAPPGTGSPYTGATENNPVAKAPGPKETITSGSTPVTGPKSSAVEEKGAKTPSRQDLSSKGLSQPATDPPVRPQPGVQSAAQGKQDTLLERLVLRDDNPFREKFLKKYEAANKEKSLRETKGRSAGNYRNIQTSSRDLSGRRAGGLTGNELGILPTIVGSPAELRVFGVIKAGDITAALTNRGELKVGSEVDGDAIASITMNEVHFKSGKVLKVSAQ